jgi:hypothetical protein
MKITLAILALLIAGLWVSGKLIWGSGVVLFQVLIIWLLVFILKAADLVMPQPPPPDLVQQMEQIQWDLCRKINEHSVEFCEAEIKRMRQKIGVQ